MGFLWLVMNMSYALGFWLVLRWSRFIFKVIYNLLLLRYGWTLTEQRDPITGEAQYTVGTILLVFFNIIIGIFTLGHAAPLVGTLASSRAAGFEVFNIIHRVNLIIQLIIYIT